MITMAARAAAPGIVRDVVTRIADKHFITIYRWSINFDGSRGCMRLPRPPTRS